MNQVLQDTIAARDLLLSGGWIPDRLRNRKSTEHCAVGAILDTVMPDGVSSTGEPASALEYNLDVRAPRVYAVLTELVKSIPSDFIYPHRYGYPYDTWNEVVEYNNSRGEQVVMDMFNSTIARLTQIEARVEQMVSV